MSILNVTHKPNNSRLFFGDFGGILRVDIVDYPIFKTLKESAEGNTWFAKEVDYTADKTKFSNLPEDAKRAFKLNIIYQTLMDSGVTGGLDKIMQEFISNSELSLLYKKIAYEESIHAESYSYGLSTVFGSEATEIIDLIYQDKFVQRRMEKEAACFDSLKYFEDNSVINPEAVSNLLKLLVSLYLLESVKFPFSFLVTFVINDSYENSIPGFTKTIKLIAHDELTIHVPTGKNIINNLKKDPLFKPLFEGGENSKFAEMVKELANDVIEQEIEWAKYLFEGKDVKGINVNIAKHFIRYQAQTRILDLGVDLGIKEEKSDIIDWYNNYRDINKQNAALQETTNISYQKGGLKNDLEGNL